jgi:hypothetical protein
VILYVCKCVVIMWVCMFVLIYVCGGGHVCLTMCVCVLDCVCMCVLVSLFVCVYLCVLFVCACMYARARACVCVCVCVNDIIRVQVCYYYVGVHVLICVWGGMCM